MIAKYEPRPRERAQECIEAFIMEKGLKAGDLLPPEREMCEMWGLNRMTLRSAIQAMVKAGRLSSVQGSGTRLNNRLCRNMQDLYGFSEYARMNGFEPETRLISFSVQECDKQLADKFKRVLGDKIYRISRLRILNGIPAMIENAFIPVEMAPGLEEHDLVNASLFDALRNGYGLELANGVEKTSITSLTDEEAEILKVETGMAALWIVSQTFDSEGNTVEYCRSVARADLIEMSSVLKWQKGGNADE